MSLTRRRRLVVYTVLLLLAFGVAGLVVLRPKTGSLISPGKLSAAHAHLDVGEDHCADCHVAKSGLDDKLCLDCHETLARRIEAKTGFHAKVEVACNSCHSEHLGVDKEIVRWPAADAPWKPIRLGLAKKEDFPHEATTGFALAGAHAKVACDGCHKAALLTDAKVIAFSGEHETFLGLAKDCAGCHLDVHTPTLGTDCAKCHDATAWKPPTTFSHDETRYPLVGKHADTKCDECHVGEVQGAPVVPPPPVPSFQALVPDGRPRPFRGVGFGKVEPARGDALPACRACHENPHRAGSETSFGRCEDCHQPHGWKNAGQVAKDAAFDHGTTRFVLDGAHAQVTCVACHGEKLDLTARTSCRDCHDSDERQAHSGAFDREMAVAQKSCDQCHTTADWKQSTYAAARHPLPLIESHAIKCEDCHGVAKHQFPRLPATALAAQGPLDQSCVACHNDVHDGKFSQDCASCHGFKAFTQDAKFSNEQHAAIGFPIEQAHLKASCEDCHGARTPSGGLRQLAIADALTKGCVVCHTDDDPHRGQFAEQACKSCHTEAAWKPSTYDEVRHQRSRLPLQGAHKAVPCAACHVTDVPPAPLAQRFHWEGRTMRCDACHTTSATIATKDPHRGQFGAQDCASCHTQEAWDPSTFGKSAHQQTGFPLVGSHDQACAACHVKGPNDVTDFIGTPRECAGCHLDPHLGQFAGRGGKDGCARCHTLMNWEPTRFDHNSQQARFPLTGRHAEVECAACHVSASRQLPDGTTRDVTHYFPIEQRACDECHQNPHAPGAREKR
jgi:hypothetical protein